MDKNYILLPNGDFVNEDELYHWGWKKKDAKYISRERKNGKWVYTYPEDANKSASKSNTGTKTSVNRSKLESAIDTAKNKLKNYVDTAKQDWEESKERSRVNATKKAAEQGATLKDSDKAGSSRTTITINGNVALNQINRGKIKRFVDDAKEYIKDRLGYDEKEVYDNASNDTNLASFRVAAETVNADEISKYLNRSDISDNQKEYYSKEYAETINRRNEYEAEYRKAKEKEEEAYKKFIDTPIGTVEKVANTGREWLEELFGVKRKKTYKVGG